MTHSGSLNPNWGGGRSIASNGYVLIRVGTSHHLADVRGYAYEHRVVAEKKLGRRLLPGEIVHHKDENKQNNGPENLEVVTGNAEHLLLHRKRDDLRMPGEPNPLIKCECGCGEEIQRYDASGRPRKFVSGHNSQRELQDAVLAALTQGPMRPVDLASLLGRSKTSISNVLGRMQAGGLVTRDSKRRAIRVIPAIRHIEFEDA